MAALFSTLLLAGCSQWQLGTLPIVAPRSDVARVLILERDVEGSWCKVQWFPGMLFVSQLDDMAANYALAVADAIRRVPEGEVLVDARLTTVVDDQVFRLEKCAVVRGDVGRLE